MSMQPLLIELGTEELPVKALPGLAQALFDGVIAVSYTHLDVYKRQAAYSAAMASNAAPNTARGFFAPKSIACRNHTKP